MATITDILDGDLISASNEVINTNFDNLNSDKIETSYLDTDTSLTANSDSKIATQKAVKTYIDTSGGANASTIIRGIVELATAAEINAGTATGATGAALVVTPDQLKLTTNPTVQTFTSLSTTRGDTTSQYDITNPAGTTFRYTYDGTGTDPGISAATFPVGIRVLIAAVSDASSINPANSGNFVVTGSGTNYFEVTNAGGSVLSNRVAYGGYIKTITAQTWTKPSGLKFAVVEVQAAGGGGGSTTTSSHSGYGGGAGGYSREVLSAASLGSTETLYVGPGGGGGIIVGGIGLPGHIGGTAEFGTLLSATAGGGATSTIESGGVGGVGSGGNINLTGGGGGSGTTISTVGSGVGGSSYMGGGGASLRGSDLNGIAGGNYGGGGSGGHSPGGTDTTGGAGGGGIIVVTEYY